MAVGTITNTVVDIGVSPASPKFVKKVSFQNTAEGSGAWLTATLPNMNGYIAKVVVTHVNPSLDPNAAFTLLLGDVGATNSMYFYGAGGPIDFTGGNTSFVFIPGQTAGSVTTPIPVLLNGTYELSTSTAQTVAAVVYQVDIYLVDTI